MTPLLSADSNGNISWSFTSSCATPVATSTIYAVDSATGSQSNTVTEIITSGYCRITQITNLLITQSCWTISPDGRTIAFIIDDISPNTGHIYAVHTDGTSMYQVTPQGITVNNGGIAMGANKIVFEGCPTVGLGCSSRPNIYVIKNDGTGLTQLTTSADGFVVEPLVMSGDGSTILFSSSTYYYGDRTFIMKSDGTGLMQVSLNLASAGQLSYDGSKIAYLTSNGNFENINIMNVDGSNNRFIVSVLDLSYNNFAFALSGDATTIAVTQGNYGLFVIKTDGTGFKTIFSPGQSRLASYPSISFDGSLVAYAGWVNGNGNSDVYVCDVDEGVTQNITNNSSGGGTLFPMMSGNGSFVAFQSYGDLDPGKNLAHSLALFYAPIMIPVPAQMELNDLPLLKILCPAISGTNVFLK